MVLSHALQIDLKEILQLDFDLFLASSGFEQRAPFFFTTAKLEGSAINKVVLAYDDRTVLKDDGNVKAFLSLDFQIIKSYENTQKDVIDSLDRILTAPTSNTIRVLIDYSCMTKVWYGTALKMIEKYSNPTVDVVELVFVYTEADYENPLDSEPNYSASFLPGFNSLDTPNKEVALIIGLGYEENRALGLIEYLHLDFDNCYVFKTDKVSNPEFYDRINTNNKNLLDLLPPEQIFEYPLNDLGYTDALLSTLVKHLNADNKRVIIAPIGPKPFSLLALLVAIKHSGVSIYRITQPPKEIPAVRKPNVSKQPIICKAIFCNKLNE